MKTTNNFRYKTSELKIYLDQLFNCVVENLEGEVKEIVKAHCFIAGGCFASLLNNEEVNDYDFYFTNYDAVNKFTSNIQSSLKKAKVFSKQNKLKYTFKQTHESDQALSFEFYPDFGKPIKIQFITKYYGEPKEVVGKFDFLHCQSYYYPATGDKSVNTDRYGKNLEFNLKSPYPMSALKRMVKFVKRGYLIPDGELLKICLAINALEINSNKDVEEQLKGMYNAQFEKLNVKTVLKELKNTSFSKKLEHLIED